MSIHYQRSYICMFISKILYLFLCEFIKIPSKVFILRGKH